MAKLNTDNYIKFDNSDEQFAFLSRAIFAFDFIKQDNTERAQRIGKDAYQFALDNKALDIVTFSGLASILLD